MAEKKPIDIEVVMTLIVNSGSARSYAMEAIAKAKTGDFAGAREALKTANEEMVGAHHIQTELLQDEARGENAELTLLMVHAQDHLMTAMLAKDLAQEIVELYEAKAQ